MLLINSCVYVAGTNELKFNSKWLSDQYILFTKSMIKVINIGKIRGNW